MINNNNENKITSNEMKTNKLITHNGAFHADEIFSSAALSILLEKRGEGYEIVRTRDEQIIESGDYVFDVGGIYDKEKNRFDHHQPGGAGSRVIKSENNKEESIEYSSFGLVWGRFGVEICGNQQIADLIDKKLVAPVDAFDNGFDLAESEYEVSPYLLQHVFMALEPTWQEGNEKRDKMFFKCVDIAKIILSREIIKTTDALLAEKLVMNIYKDAEDKRIVVLPQDYPYEDILYKLPEPLYVIYPRKTDNTWGVKAVREDAKMFKNRKDFPKTWGGLWDEELQKITGVSDAVFCHRGLFLVVVKSKEGAVQLAKLALAS